MAVPPGTPRTMSIVDTEGSRHVTDVWPAGVSGLGLTPSNVDPTGRAWRVIHLDSGMVLAGSHSLERATHMAHSFAYVCEGRQVGSLERITSDADLMKALHNVTRVYA